MTTLYTQLSYFLHRRQVSLPLTDWIHVFPVTTGKSRENPVIAGKITKTFGVVISAKNMHQFVIVFHVVSVIGQNLISYNKK